MKPKQLIKESRNVVFNPVLRLCKSCGCMTKTIKSKCGKCKVNKNEEV